MSVRWRFGSGFGVGSVLASLPVSVGLKAPARVGAGVVTFRILIVGVGLQSSACGSSSSVSACGARPTHNMLLDTNAHLENGSIRMRISKNGSILENGSIDTNAPPLISVL